jgi:hypothetical protein
MVPTFTTESIDEGGAHLDPDSIATATPRTFTVASPPDHLAGFGVDPHRTRRRKVTHCTPTPICQVRVGIGLTGLQTVVPRVHLLVSACRTRVV